MNACSTTSRGFRSILHRRAPAIDLLAFLSRWLGFLKRAPLFPHLVDAVLLLWTLLTRPGIAAAIEEVRVVALSWEGVGIAPHRFGGCEFLLQGREIGHLHGNGVLDLPLPRALKDRLVSEGCGREHHTHPGTGWLSFSLTRADDAAPALKLLRLAYENVRAVPSIGRRA